MGNPFKEQILDLFVLYTHDIKDKDVLKTVNSIETLGKSQFQKFFKAELRPNRRPFSNQLKGTNYLFLAS